MSDFVGKDPRGIWVVLPERRWEHAVKHTEHLGRYTLAIQALTDPDVILDNVDHLPSALLPPRTAIERYVRWFDELNLHLILPVEELLTPALVPGYGRVPEGSRSVKTAYGQRTIPPGAILWRRP